MKFSVIFVLLFSFVLYPLAASAEGIREERPNLIGGEIGGKAVFYNVSYERYFFNRLGLGAGAMGIGSKGGAWGLFPIYLSLVPVGNNHALYMAGGGTIVAGSIDWEDVTSTWLGLFSLGYQYQSEGGLFVRATMNMIYKGEGFVILPGIAIGGSF